MKITCQLLFMLFVAFHVHGQIDITKGGSGRMVINQSFNETRGVDLTVISGAVAVTSVTLHKLNMGTYGFTGFRVYNSTTKALLYARDSIIDTTMMRGASISFPVAMTFMPGVSYRVCFYSYDTATTGSGSFYVPEFPYIEHTNHFRINNAFAVPSDSFPEMWNLAVPYITFSSGQQVGIHEQETVAGIRLFPNPFTDQSILETSIVLEDASLVVYNLAGQIVRQMDHLNGTQVAINRDNLAAGTYFVRLLQGQTTRFTGPVTIKD